LKTRLFSLFSLIILFLSIQNVHARQWQATLDFSLGAPQGAFSNEIERLGAGLNISGGYQFRESPFMIGLDLGFLNFGSDSRDEPLSTTIPDLRVRVDNSYNLATGNIFVRVLAPEMSVKPYLDALVGFNYFYTETTISERGFGSAEPVLRDTNFEDVALNYGFGSGVMINVFRRDSRDEGNYTHYVNSAYVNIGARYLFGNEAEYLKKGSITRENGEVFFDVQRSKTDLLYFKIGVGIVF
jgi:hypothetical protein